MLGRLLGVVAVSSWRYFVTLDKSAETNNQPDKKDALPAEFVQRAAEKFERDTQEKLAQNEEWRRESQALPK